jgi:hypothetical protein
MDLGNSKHIFAILAYKESPYLEDCIYSLKNQDLLSKIQIFTSTPNKHIQTIAEKHNIKINTNINGGTISKDWNFALKNCNSTWITLVHQDDIYFNNFFKAVESNFSTDTAIIFTNYQHIKQGQIISGGILTLVKSILLLPFHISKKIKSILLKKSVLMLGSPFCCPSATYNLDLLHDFEFDTTMKVSLDWEAWYRIATKPFAIVYLKQPLMAHRIHRDSETTNMIRDNTRKNEDKLIFEKLWGKFFGRIISLLYKLSYKLNS